MSDLSLWWHRLGSPPHFYRLAGRFSRGFAAAALVFLSVGAVWGLALAPSDAVQGESYRIIYVHVPVTFVALSNYLLMCAAAVCALVWRMKLAEIAMCEAAPIGAALSLATLVTGAVWGKPTWGAWWVWDARVTSMLALFFIYLGLTALRRAYGDLSPAAVRACAVLCLIGSVDLLIVHKSVDWWYSLHQPATIRLGRAPSMHPAMWRPLLVMIVGMYLCYAALLLSWMRTEVLRRSRRSRWARELS